MILKINMNFEVRAGRDASFLSSSRFIFLLIFLLNMIAVVSSAGGAALFDDDFKRTSGLGSAWRVTAGSFSTDGEFAVSSGSTSWAYVAADPGTSDYTVASTLLVPAGSLYSGIVARGNPATNFYSDLYAAQISTQGSVNLYRRNAGSWTLLKSAAAAIAANQAYDLKLKVSGSNPVVLEVSLGGTLLITYSDASVSRLLSGAPGIENYNSGVKYDRFTVTTDSAPPVNQPPTARMTATPASGAAPLTVGFNGNASSDPDGTIVSYAWNFGDGTAGTGPAPSHTYSQPGSYTATLTVTDNNGAVGSSQVSIIAGPGTTGAVLFNDDFSRTTGLGADWKVQVGSFITNGSAAVSQGSQNWAAVAPDLKSNDYTAEAVLTLPAGSLYTGVVVRGSPTGSFYQNLYAAQLSVNGTANLYRRNSGSWTLLKGVSAGVVAKKDYTVRLKVSGSNPVNLEVSLNGALLFTYADASSSRILTGIPGIEDYTGGTSYDRFTVYSATHLFPTARITATPSSGAAPLPVHFDGSGSSDPDGAIVSYRWNFGDGSSGTGPQADHTYSADGVYSVELVVTDDTGATGSARSNVVVGSTVVSRFAYAANSGSNNVTMYTIDPGTGALKNIGSVPAGSQPYVVAVDPKGRFAYAGNFASNTISIYRIDPGSGILTPAGTAATGTSPYSIAVDPAGAFLYVANENSATDVWIYRIDPASGALTSLGTAVAGISPISVTVDPLGAFAYVANTSSNNVSMYAVDGTTGALTRLGEVAAGAGANGVAVDPTGRFAYVVNYNANDLWFYTIDRSTGRLTKRGAIAAGVQPFSVAVDPSGQFVYAANSGTNNLSLYRIDGNTGALTSLGAVAAGSGPRSVTVDRSGKFVYAANLNSNDVFVYSIDRATGLLTAEGRYQAGTITRSVATAVGGN